MIDLLSGGIETKSSVDQVWSGRSNSTSASATISASGLYTPRSDLMTLKFISDWQIQISRAVSFTKFSANWDDAGSPPVNSLTVQLAIRKFADIITLVPAPSFSPGAEGDLWALWAAFGLDIEVCFKGKDYIFAMVEDYHGEIEDFSDLDLELTTVVVALAELSRRSNNYYARTSIRSDIQNYGSPRFFSRFPALPSSSGAETIAILL